MDSTSLKEFSIIRGGFFYRLQERLNLVNENDSRVVVRAVVFALVSYLPLLILAALQGVAINENAHRSLLLDFSAYGRFLIAVPLFILAENVIDDRYVTIASYFSNSGIVPDDERSRYRDILSSARRLVTSVTAEIILLMLALLNSVLSTSDEYIYRIDEWRNSENGGLSLAGWWFLLVGAPLFLFLLFRWLWRLIVWCIFLWRISRLKLQLIPTHPDSVGGLGILSESINAFTPIVFALSAVLSAVWVKRVVYGGHDVTEYHRPIIVFLLLTIAAAVVPLMIFLPRLLKLKLRGLHDYGVLANRHSLLFDEKWIREIENNVEDVLGTPDVSSLADLGTGFQTVQKIKFFPFGTQNLALLAAAALIPMIPLLLIEVPFKELVLKIAETLI